MPANGLWRNKEVAEEIGITPLTLMRWVKAKKVPEPLRDRNDRPVWTNEQVGAIKRFAFLTKHPEE